MQKINKTCVRDLESKDELDEVKWIEIVEKSGLSGNERLNFGSTWGPVPGLYVNHVFLTNGMRIMTVLSLTLRIPKSCGRSSQDAHKI